MGVHGQGAINVQRAFNSTILGCSNSCQENVLTFISCRKTRWRLCAMPSQCTWSTFQRILPLPRSLQKRSLSSQSRQKPGQTSYPTYSKCFRHEQSASRACSNFSKLSLKSTKTARLASRESGGGHLVTISTLLQRPSLVSWSTAQRWQIASMLGAS